MLNTSSLVRSVNLSLFLQPKLRSCKIYQWEFLWSGRKDTALFATTRDLSVDRNNIGFKDENFRWGTSDNSRLDLWKKNWTEIDPFWISKIRNWRMAVMESSDLRKVVLRSSSLTCKVISLRNEVVLEKFKWIEVNCSWDSKWNCLRKLQKSRSEFGTKTRDDIVWENSRRIGVALGTFCPGRGKRENLDLA